MLGLRLSSHTDTVTEASNVIDELYKRSGIQNKQQYRNALNKFSTLLMELPSKLLEQFAINTRPKIEELMLIVMDKSIHEEHLSQPLKTKKKQFKKPVTFLIGYNGILKVTAENNEFYFMKIITDESGFFKVVVLPVAHEIESLNIDNIKIIIEKGHFTEEDYPFTVKPDFFTLGNIIEISPQGPRISFMCDDSIRDLLGFNDNK